MIPKVEDLALQWDILDFKPTRGLFTWSNNRVGEGHISTCLDWFLVQSSLLLEKRLISSKILPKLNYDHKPILLLLEEEENLGLILFRFSPCWSERDGFINTIRLAWSKSIIGSPSYLWERKLKATKNVPLTQSHLRNHHS